VAVSWERRAMVSKEIKQHPNYACIGLDESVQCARLSVVDSLLLSVAVLRS